MRNPLDLRVGGRTLKTISTSLGLTLWMAVNVATLPEDPSALRAIILEQDRRIEQLEHYLVQLRRWQFGAKSERIHPAQLLLGFAGQVESAPSQEAPQAPLRVRRRHPGRRTIPAELPAKVTVHDLSEAERACPGCGKDRVAIGHEKTSRLEFKPADFYQDVHLRTKYACRHCEDHVETAPGPALVGPTERGLPGPGLLAQVIVSKFADHIPCYRQVRMFRRQGVDLALSTVVGWMRPAMELLAPIVAAMRKDVLAAPIIQTDDTVVRLIDPGFGRCRQARLWGYLGNGQVVYEFTPNRREEHPLRFLGNYRGYVQADAYRGYDKLFAQGSGRTELACWAHTRRYFFEAKETDAERSMAALALIRRLYVVEDEARGKPPEERVRLRREKARPILEEIGTWIDRESLRVLPQSPIGEAIRYAAHQWAALVRYVDIGEAEIDNNNLERLLRGVALGRKNYLHFASEGGGAAGAVAYSLIESCKLAGVEPWAYLKDVLMRVWTHPADRIAELMPRNWRPPPESPNTS